MTKSTRTRATTIEEYNTRFTGITTDYGRNLGLQFQPNPSDIIITPYSKSGTTWLQQIVHGLRTRGDMAFDDISRVVPWLEVSYDLGLDINAPQHAHPRTFKSHLNWYNIPKGGRYIVSIRDPKDVLVSSFRFVEGWFFAVNSISLTDYAQSEFLNPDPQKGYWHHLLSWWSQRDNEQVLLLSFEEMKRDLPKTIRTVAKFCGIELDDELFETALKQSSFDFMKQHQNRFDDRLMRERSEEICELPPNSDSSKVRMGQTGVYKAELTAVLAQQLDDIWQATIEPALGFSTYEAFQQAVVALTADFDTT